MNYPLIIWCQETEIVTSLIEISAINIKNVLKAFSIPVEEVIYYRTIANTPMHMFCALDSDMTVIYLSASKLASITGKLNMKILSKYSYVSDDPLCAMIPKSRRLYRDPPLFGFVEGVMEFGRVYDIEKLKKDGYIAMLFTPLPGVDFQIQMLRELAEMWGIEFVKPIDPDIMIFRTREISDISNEEWLRMNLSRILEDGLPLATIEGKWMLSKESRAQILLKCLEFFRSAKLPYITSSTFYCHVSKNLSVTCALGCIRDMFQLKEYLETTNIRLHEMTIDRNSSKEEIAKKVYREDTSKGRAIALKEKNGWHIVQTEDFDQDAEPNIIDNLRKYYDINCKNEVSSYELMEITRIADCPQSTNSVCITPGSKNLEENVSSVAMKHALGINRSRHKTFGIYSLGPYESPFFPSYPVTILPPSRYGLSLSKVVFRKESEDPEDFLLRQIVGTIWSLYVHDRNSSIDVPTRYEILQVASDKTEEVIKDITYHAWSCGFLLGNWTKVMLKHADKISVSVSGSDPYISQATDSIADGNRWLSMIQKTMEECTEPPGTCRNMTYTRHKIK